MAAVETGRTVPVGLASRNTACWLILPPPEVLPTAMTVPPDPTVAPSTFWVAAWPSDPVGCQVPPVSVLV